MLGGGAGHIADMISRMKQNQNLLKRKRYFKNQLEYRRALNRKKLKYNEASKEELRELREELIHSRKKHYRTSITFIEYSN
jgi:hypothetical protein